MQLPRRRFLNLAASAVAMPALLRNARADTYPSRPVHLAGRLSARRRRRHHRAADRANAVGAARPALRRREPRPARQQIATEAVVQRGAGRLHALVDGQSATSSMRCSIRNLNFNFIHDIAPVGGIDRNPLILEVNPVVAGQDRSRVHRLRQGASGQAQHGVRRHRQRRRISPANCSR